MEKPFEKRRYTIDVPCPECKHVFGHQVELTIHEPDIMVDVSSILWSHK